MLGATFVNGLFLTTQIRIAVIEIIIVTIWVPLLFASRNGRIKLTDDTFAQILTELNLVEPITGLVPRSTSSWYVIAMVVTIGVYFLLINLAGLNLQASQAVVNKLNTLKSI